MKTQGSQCPVKIQLIKWIGSWSRHILICCIQMESKAWTSLVFNSFGGLILICSVCSLLANIYKYIVLSACLILFIIIYRKQKVNETTNRCGIFLMEISGWILINYVPSWYRSLYFKYIIYLLKMTTIRRAKVKLLRTLIYTSVAKYQVEVYMGLEKYQTQFSKVHLHDEFKYM